MATVHALLPGQTVEAFIPLCGNFLSSANSEAAPVLTGGEAESESLVLSLEHRSSFCKKMRR